MKNPISILLILTLIFSQNLIAQKVIKTDKAIYKIEGQYYFEISKIDINTKKVYYKVETEIPDKSKKEMFYPGGNHAIFDIIGDNMVIVYDIWQKKAETKDCFIKLMNTKTGSFTEPQLLYSTKLNSVYSSNELIYKPIYSPDKSKLAVLKDNISPGYPIEPEITIYETETFSAISTKKLSGKYENQKRIFDQKKFEMDNDGNISVVFHLMNEETRLTTKSYSADIPFIAGDLKNIKAFNETSSLENVTNQTSHGSFYKSIQDLIDDNPIPGVRIKNGSFSWSLVTGADFKLIDDAGNLKREDSKDLPSTIFTYKRHDNSSPFVLRIIDKKPYIILSAGSINYYALYQDQERRYIAEGWNGDLKKFSGRAFEKYLEKEGLLEAYRNDKPKREFKDSVNDFFNKEINWQIKYFNLLNEKLR